MSWDSPTLRSFAERLVRRRLDVGEVGAGALAHPSAGARSAEFVEQVLRDRARAGAEARFAWNVLGRDEVPRHVLEQMNRVQKPFQLWNVQRVEVKGAFELVPQEPFRVGGAAAPSGEEGMPRALPTSTAALRGLREEQEMEEMRARMNRQRFRQLLRDPLPYGKRDDEPEDAPAWSGFGGGFGGGAEGGFSGGFGGGGGGGFSGGFGGGGFSGGSGPPDQGGFSGGFGPPGQGGFSGGFGPPGQGGFSGGFGPPGQGGFSGGFGPPGQGGFGGVFGPPGQDEDQDEDGFSGGFGD
ncbi:MAG: hypothetical protein AB7N76_24505 [Planctomycetota bacterium]